MRLFFSLLPIFIFGNLHCAGMCGPLVMLLATHPFRWLYFLGRAVSFTLAGLLSAEAGFVFFEILVRYHISTFFIFFFGLSICLFGCSLLLNFRLPGTFWFSIRSAKLSSYLSRILFIQRPYAPLLFGACTVLLPCGQTILVFSIIALHQEPIIGLLNGLLFALFTSPALIGALIAPRFVLRNKKGYRYLVGLATLCIGILSILRGLADLQMIQHLSFSIFSRFDCHIVLY